jgi:hypothetical protein
MSADPITSAARAKGPLALLKRAHSITDRYGLTPARMDRALRRFVQVVGRFDCGATFPVTAVVLKRNSDEIVRYLDQNVEFAVHGYAHVDSSRLSPEEQYAHLRRAREVFVNRGIEATGFRSPYLCRGAHLHAAAEAAGFSYVSNQPILWDVLDADAFGSSGRAAYQRAIAFYKPWHADERPSLPRVCNQLIEIPVSLPDDEILVDRLGGGNGLVEDAWRRILSQSHQRGELFTVQLHPERIAGCAGELSAVLAEARTLTPSVWLARLDEVATWWRARTRATAEITNAGDGRFHVMVVGPGGTTVLARAVEVEAPTVPWADGYQRVRGMTFDRPFAVRASRRPCIGLSPPTSPGLASFLRQQGYIVETGEDGQCYSHYFDQTEFIAEQERPLLAQIEGSNRPLLRLGRWPDGARSALAVTGDIDALTLWDYGYRLFGR